MLLEETAYPVCGCWSRCWPHSRPHRPGWRCTCSWDRVYRSEDWGRSQAARATTITSVVPIPAAGWSTVEVFITILTTWGRGGTVHVILYIILTSLTRESIYEVSEFVRHFEQV